MKKLKIGIIGVGRLGYEHACNIASRVPGSELVAICDGNLARAQEVADELGAEVGASRGLVETGSITKDHQVGQTGKTVRPLVYIACGISGAVQHTAGMDKAELIIAINTDPNASIFQIAHIGIVGDALEILPKLKEELINLKS